MYLKSLVLKGFKSFPERTRLEFGPGVSVIIGPNGSGKSNITDAVLWVLGEQSPLAVRGSSMQDVIFGGGPGSQPRSAAEVEMVLDNSDGAVALPLSEISIVRRLERSGEGEYRLGGTRCRLIDVMEALSDTGLGKETHSVVSQGRIESIVTSKPRDRRLLAQHPQNGIGDVGLPGSVGPDDHAHAGAELEVRALREGLEALEDQRPQVHARRLIAGSPPSP